MTNEAEVVLELSLELVSSCLDSLEHGLEVHWEAMAIKKPIAGDRARSMGQRRTRGVARWEGGMEWISVELKTWRVRQDRR